MRRGKWCAVTFRVMIIEDDAAMADALCDLCRRWEMTPGRIDDFHAVEEETVAFQPHLILLDLTLPYYDGFYWCGRLRRHTSAPILFLSSAGESVNMVAAMNLGADDFIAKPFDAALLAAKMRALLRRAYSFAAESPTLCCRGAFLHPAAGTLTVGDVTLPLTKNESRILLCLFENKGKTVSRETLMERLWKTMEFVDENTLTVNVNRLRKKLAAAGLADLIVTRVGEGYRVEEGET